MSCSDVCPSIEVVLKNEEGWCTIYLSPAQLLQQRFQFDSVVFIFAQGDKVRSCGVCRSHFERIFQVPESWWSTWCRRANGYFGAEETVDKDGRMEAHNKPLENERDYVWYKFNIFTHWVAQERTTYVLIFDPRSEVRDLISGFSHTPDRARKDLYAKNPSVDLAEVDKNEPLQERFNEHNEVEMKPDTRAVTGSNVLKTSKGLKPRCLLDRLPSQRLTNPYAVHALFMEEVVYQLEESIWGIRDRLRGVELQRTSKANLNPDYEVVHDVARHAIHVNETVDAAICTILSIKAEHEQFRKLQDPAIKEDNTESNRIRRNLDFSESMLRNLRFRSSSNTTRLQNEIQLAFNIVSQQIGRSAKADSNAMLGIALLTMLFLPPTFMSGIFSMSFFDFDSEHDRWVWSSKFWLYWACTLPITLFSVVLFGGFYVINHPAQVGGSTQTELEKIRFDNLLLQLKTRGKRSQPSPA